MANTRTAEELLGLVSSELGSKLLDSSTAAGDLSILVPADSIHEVLRRLRDNGELAFDLMSYMTAVDYQPQEPRFELVYDMYSTATADRIRVRCRLADTGSEEQLPVIDSVSDMFATSDWHERETYDLFGIEFRNHPNLRRILLPQNWDGHPLRREYPYDGKPAWKLGTSVAEPDAKFDILDY